MEASPVFFMSGVMIFNISSGEPEVLAVCVLLNTVITKLCVFMI